MLGFDTSRASSDSRGLPAALRSREEVSAVVTWSPSSWLAMAGPCLHLQTRLPSADCKTQPLKWEGTPPVGHFCSDMKCRSAKVLSLSLLKWTGDHVRVKDLHTVARDPVSFSCLELPISGLGERGGSFLLLWHSDSEGALESESYKLFCINPDKHWHRICAGTQWK